MVNFHSVPALRPAAGPALISARAGRIRHSHLTALGVGLLVLLATAPAFAQAAGGGGDLSTFLQNLVNLLTGTPGKLIAVIAICILGIGAVMGALSLRTAGGVLLGIMLIFSSAWIVTQIVGA
ncbi:Type IV secretory pathway AvhB2 protein [Azospirillum melinis]|uniref:Type IV secretory pathway AvhB2 protein n=1 Tax=Azospirillum melinis TaxID=328839 RepID=A0ABX2KED2_9PROT|nr:TrbC/VirB2 family protein [Azospirillum melinis]MBP2307505.1 type IV secretory pathway VirB2 component (pilin) [Azospirillum melinis]NUB01950.1 Type IV secretory pathway AvhB2 protein [Azospirillum melinis]